MGTKLLLLDLDHTIIRPLEGRTFPKDNNDWEFIPGILTYLKQWYDRGYKFFIVSNQGGIEYGYLTDAEFRQKIDEVIRQIKAHLAIPSWQYKSILYLYSTTNNKRNYLRKPNIGMGITALGVHRVETLENVIMIGDMDSDKQFAENLGIKFIRIQDALNNN